MLKNIRGELTPLQDDDSQNVVNTNNIIGGIAKALDLSANSEVEQVSLNPYFLSKIILKSKKITFLSFSSALIQDIYHLLQGYVSYTNFKTELHCIISIHNTDFL